jgi:hypothetical protein
VRELLRSLGERAAPKLLVHLFESRNFHKTKSVSSAFSSRDGGERKQKKVDRFFVARTRLILWW